MEKLDELKKLAEAAMVGPWKPDPTFSAAAGPAVVAKLLEMIEVLAVGLRHIEEAPFSDRNGGKQQALGKDFEQVLCDNLWNLYVRS